jgi:hypothetical protein
MEIKLEVALVAAHIERLVVGYKPSSWPECYHKAFARFRWADNVRSQKHFINEIVWKRRSGFMGTYNKFGAITDTLLWFSKSDDYIFFEQSGPNDPEYLERFKYKNEEGRFYRLDNLTSPNPRPNLKYIYKGFQPPDNGWAVSREKMEQMDSEGRLEFPKKPSGRIQRRRFASLPSGVRARIGFPGLLFLLVRPTGRGRLSHIRQ